MTVLTALRRPSRLAATSLGQQSSLPPLLVTSARHLAKAKKGGKDKKAKGEASSSDADAAPPSIDAAKLRTQLDRPLKHLQREYTSMQAGRAVPSMLDLVRVNTGGAEVPLPSLAKVLVQSPQMLTVSVFDPSREAVAAVAKAIEDSPLGLRAEQAGKMLRVPVPRPTKDSRRALATEAKVLAEAAKTAVRSVRQKAMKVAKGDASKEEVKRSEKLVEELVQASNLAIDGALKAKQADVMNI